jgi:hypothetical protein
MIPAEGLQFVELLNLSKGLLGSLMDEMLEKRAAMMPGMTLI